MAAIPHSDVLEPVSARCQDCRGTGVAAEVTPACLTCGAQWTYPRFDRWMDRHDRGDDPRWGRWILPGWLACLVRSVLFALPSYRAGWGYHWRYRWEALPCGHAIEECLCFVDVACASCHGVGTVTHWQLSARYKQRQRALLTAQQRPQVNRAAPMPMRAMTPRLATAPTSAYVQRQQR